MAGASRPRTVLIAAAAAIALCITVFVGIGAWAVYRHMSARFVDAASADAAFAAARAGVARTEPLFEVRTGGGRLEPIVHRGAPGDAQPIVALHVLAYDRRSRKLTRVDLPRWLLQWISARGTVRLANLDVFDDERDRVTLEDLDRRGPGLVAEIAGPPHVLIWTE